jgi:hypothetical protein
MASLGLGNEDKIGVKLMGGYTFRADSGATPSKGYKAPGHNSVLLESNRYFLAHHTRTFTLPEYWFY